MMSTPPFSAVIFEGSGLLLGGLGSEKDSRDGGIGNGKMGTRRKGEKRKSRQKEQQKRGLEDKKNRGEEEKRHSMVRAFLQSLRGSFAQEEGHSAGGI